MDENIKRSKNLQEGVLGDLYKSAVHLPIQAIKLPFKTYKTLYGKHNHKDEYTGTFLQKQRLKKVLVLIHKGSILSSNDKLFMDMVNRFMTEQGHKPIDQTNVELNCPSGNNCTRYIFAGFNKSNKPKSSNTTKSSKDELLPIGVYEIRFDSELQPKNSTHTFKKGHTYRLVVTKVFRDRGMTYIHLKNSFLDENDFLIFKTELRSPINDPTLFKVYQNNSVSPLRTPTKLGPVIAKIF